MKFLEFYSGCQVKNKAKNRPFSLVHFFPNTGHVLILRRFGPFFWSLKRVHADIFMLACTLFNHQNKDQSSWVLSRDLYWVNKMYKRKRSIWLTIEQLILCMPNETMLFLCRNMKSDNLLLAKRTENFRRALPNG